MLDDAITNSLFSRETGKKYWIKNGSGAKREILPPQLVQSFKLKQIVCVEYDQITEDQEREVFQVKYKYL